MFDSIIDYTTAVVVTIMLMVVIGGLITFVLAFYAERKRTILAHEKAIAIAEIEAKQTRPTALQERILAQHYRPEMEILYAHALEFGHEPAYLDALEAFRANYPQSYALWIRYHGRSTSLNDHMAAYTGWDEIQS